MFETIPEGQYNAKIESATYDPTRKSIGWCFKILKEKYQNRKIWKNTPTEGKGMYFTNLLLAPFDQKIDDKNLESLPQILEMIVLKNVLLYVEHSKYKSQKSPDKMYYDVKIDGLIDNDEITIDTNEIPF